MGHTSSGTPTGGESILIVDDEASLRSLMATVLTRRGYRVMTCAGAADAARVMRTCGTLHLVVTDLVMPSGNGLQVVEAVRELQPGAKVLIMSGYADHATFDVTRLTADGHFLQKPFTPTTFVRKVREVLDARPDDPGRASRTSR